MPILICQRKNSDKIIRAVKALAPIEINDKKFGKFTVKPGSYLIRDGLEAYAISEIEFEDTYLVRRIV